MEIKDIRRARLRLWFSERCIPEKEKSYLSQLMGGKASFGERAARRLEHDYGMGDKYLDTPIGGQDAPTSTEVNLLNNPDYPAIRRVNLRLSAGICGYSVDYDDDSGDMIVFGRRWYEKNNYKPEKLIAIRVQGHSMETGLNQNDTVVINTADNTPRDGEVFAVNYDGEAVIKRMVRDRSEWWLASDNPDQVRYPRKLCTGEGCIIIGRVVHKQSERI